MRASLLMSAALLGLSAGAANAQNSVGSAQTPPSPGASSQGPQPTNSIPAGAATSSTPTPGSNLGAAPPPAYAPRGTVVYGTPGRTRPTARATPEVTAGGVEQAAPPTSAYRGGAGSPYSARASNTTSANTRSEVAPRLPDPDAAANTPEALLAAAQRSLRAGRTGAAQEALERAETRVLSRTTDPSMAGTPDQAAMVRHIGDARRALGNRNPAAADASISAAMASPIPPRGPTVTTTYPVDPALAAPPPGYVGAPGYPPPGYPQPGYAQPGYAPPAYAPGYAPPPAYAPGYAPTYVPPGVPPRGY